MNSIGNILLKYRKLGEMNQEDVCKTMDVDLKTYSDWERGKLIPDGKALRRLSEVLDFSLEEIISENSREQRKQKRCNVALFCISAVMFLLITSMLLIPALQDLFLDTEDAINGYFGRPVASIIELIANPEQYHGKLVQVVGVGNLEFEGDFISLSKEDWQYGGDHRIWINIGDIGMTYEEAQAYNGKYVIVEGIFNMNEHGHMGLFQGAIENVSRYDLWFTEESWYNDQTNETGADTNE